MGSIGCITGSFERVFGVSEQPDTTAKRDNVENRLLYSYPVTTGQIFPVPPFLFIIHLPLLTNPTIKFLQKVVEENYLDKDICFG